MYVCVDMVQRDMSKFNPPGECKDTVLAPSIFSVYDGTCLFTKLLFPQGRIEPDFLLYTEYSQKVDILSILSSGLASILMASLFITKQQVEQAYLSINSITLISLGQVG